jgi:3',5'-cyclic-AMP phosphodiesterase
MPIHLAPISRRRFLLRSLAAGAGLAVSPRLWPADKPADPDFWALLSDIHLAADRNMVARGVNMTGHFKSASLDLLSLSARPAGVFINGDCALQSGEMGDYAVLADLLKPLREAQMPIHLALGNHDNRFRFWQAFQDANAARRPLEDKYVSLLSTPRVNWLILDSLDKTASTPGLLGKEQLTWLANTLDANKDKPAIVLIHHNPGLAGNIGLKDTTALFEVIRPRKQVKAYIFGHTHTWRVEKDSSGIHLINLPAVAYVFSPGEPSGWVGATLADGGMKIELHCIDPTHKANGQTFNLKWRA